jgi:mRNA interferase MazF
MRYGIMYRQGDIVLISIPYTDLSSSKKRPVLIISNDGYNMNTDDFIVAAITSNIDDKTYAVMITNDDLNEGILLHPSCVRADKIYTLSQSIVIRKFGTVKNAFLANVYENVKKVLNVNQQSQ